MIETVYVTTMVAIITGALCAFLGYGFGYKKGYKHGKNAKHYVPPQPSAIFGGNDTSQTL